ncbi:rCG31884 [Rattus norvegicus]|uniref:RCG31884 n=1 Tax=Rattus norvegicus TaxID=10116 RepID=A6JN39_RAT|nr:rCG31884 [Rattus norvegicus]
MAAGCHKHWHPVWAFTLQFLTPQCLIHPNHQRLSLTQLVHFRKWLLLVGGDSPNVLFSGRKICLDSGYTTIFKLVSFMESGKRD